MCGLHFQRFYRRITAHQLPFVSWQRNRLLVSGTSHCSSVCCLPTLCDRCTKMTDMLLGVEAAGKVYASRSKTIVLTTSFCSLLVIVNNPTPAKLTSAFRQLYDQTNAQHRYNNDDFLTRVKPIPNKATAIARLNEQADSDLRPEALLLWEKVPVQATIFYVN